MTESSSSLPCDLSEPDRDERARAWRALGPFVVSRVRSAEGFRVTFGLAALERIERLVAAERSCCGWATWSVGADDDHAVLDVSGPQAEVEALADAFGL